ncbi:MULTISPECIES: hypothetical protein [Cytobacillus]|uniref:Uncharacterized protein n=1 Tax=Cytobacillus pseudoceanisediminis TaxID=3051614 RepID=A0ABZ2ZQS3_9BACI|nr:MULTISPECIES: hypothetical protein [Cytobacillus]EFV76209.1 hypothetical protein HMPREF1013_03621 [Bacillus sp. 2_A_57_CT2]MBY0156271.1 hypothetical protein [Cytobacillus firmus]MBU8769065.1 hypothetical protein [Cytobacillus oceanisediminis]MCM3244174.1 hypothetical protein [Cytobacillus oceanisediminis]MCM3402567.1 hypothetical protein [Cytobacillus oceanisediminis]
MLDNQAKKERSLSPLVSSAVDERQPAGTTPADTNTIKSIEPEFDLSGTVLNDYN